MGVTSWIANKILASKLKGLPEDQQKMFMEMFEKNPELLKKIAEEIDARMKKGEHQMYATMEVMKKYSKDIQALLGTSVQQTKQRMY
jgi:hypothetical protein